MKIVNLTPHSITFFDAAGNAVLTVEPSGQIARCSVAREKIGDINGIPVNKSKFGEVENLPEPEEGTIYVVSALTAPDGRTVGTNSPVLRGPGKNRGYQWYPGKQIQVRGSGKPP